MPDTAPGTPAAVPPAPPGTPRGGLLHGTARLVKGTVHTVSYLTSNEVYIYTSAIAFNVLLAIFPYLIVIITLARTLFPGWGLDQQLLEIIGDYFPTAENFVTTNLNAVSHKWGSLTWLSALLTLMAGSSLFVPIELALNRALHKDGERNFIVSNAMSFGLFLVCGAIFFGAAMLATLPLKLFDLAFAALAEYVRLPLLHQGIEIVITKLFTVPAICLCFFVIYWSLPLPPRPPVRPMLVAAVAMGLLWELGRIVYVLALPLFEFQKYYGAFYVTVSLVTLAFFSGFILLLGPHLVAKRLAAMPELPRADEPDG
ncbi:MAG TPA: YihY/virulence factor BrkB family protein, partial [bacterium]|nr:YihY/virulence factor BrkB family protein [bacterium]